MHNGRRAEISVKWLVLDTVAVLGLAALCRYRLYVLWYPKTFADVWTVAAFGICCMGSFKAMCDMLGSRPAKRLGQWRQTARITLLIPRAMAVALFCLGLELGTAWIFMLPSRWRRPPYQPDTWVVALVLSALLWTMVFGRLWWKEHRGDPMPEK